MLTTQRAVGTNAYQGIVGNAPDARSDFGDEAKTKAAEAGNPIVQLHTPVSGSLTSRTALCQLQHGIVHREEVARLLAATSKVSRSFTPQLQTPTTESAIANATSIVHSPVAEGTESAVAVEAHERTVEDFAGSAAAVTDDRAAASAAGATRAKVEDPHQSAGRGAEGATGVSDTQKNAKDQWTPEAAGVASTPTSVEDASVGAERFACVSEDTVLTNRSLQSWASRPTPARVETAVSDLLFSRKTSPFPV